jgi:arylsulfatase A
MKSETSEWRPNLVVVYADDLGYGDVQCYNPDRGRIPTSCMDRLASQGMRFTDAHASSAVCTPSRYTILTGRYHWRTRLQKGVLGGMSEPLVAPDRLTVAGLFKEQDYTTACIGKWHLGMNMPQPITEGVIEQGPITNGFDYFFGISASLDMAPFAFIENDRFTEAPTAEKTLLMVNGKPRRGPAAPDFESEQVLPMLVQKSVEWIEAQKDRPFFLYLALNSPHTPLAPAEAWKGKSGLGDYADFVMQTDAAVGEVMAALDENGITENTLVIVTSDNGCAPYVGTKISADPRDSHDRMDAVTDLEERGHYPSGPLRGYKSDAWEGGHRVPFILRWPSVVREASTCDSLVHQADIMATAADIMGVDLPDDAGEDSFSFKPLLENSTAHIRDHSVSASLFGVPCMRFGQWLYIPAPGSGGWGEGGDQSQPVQLYDLGTDIGQSKNLAADQPERVEHLQSLLERIISQGRSTPGPAQENDVEVQRYAPEPGG